MGVKRETLNNGRVLKILIEEFANDRTKDNLIPVLHCLRDSFVWIPGTMRLSNDDAEKFINSRAGDTITTNNVMKFEPDILQNGEDKFYPVFSSIEEMGEYGNNFSKVDFINLNNKFHYAIFYLWRAHSLVFDLLKNL